MFRLISKTIIIVLNSVFLCLLLVLPMQCNKLGLCNQIFPALDLIIVYYLVTNHNIKYWHLFILGIMIDQLYNFPLGTNSTIFILMHKTNNILNKWFLLKNYQNNLIVFCIYSLIVISARYLVIIIKSNYYIGSYGVICYYFSTILSYPILNILISKSVQKILQNVK